MIKVNVIVRDNVWLKYIKDPKLYLKKKVKKIQKDKFFSKNKVFNFNLLLSGSKEIRALNKKFRNKDKSTDILSFPQQDKKYLKKLIEKKRDIFLGDMIINFQKVNSKSLRVFNDHFNILGCMVYYICLAMIIKKILILRR